MNFNAMEYDNIIDMCRGLNGGLQKMYIHVLIPRTRTLYDESKLHVKNIIA